MSNTSNGRSAPNGRAADAPSPLKMLRLGDLTPERVPVEAGPGRMLYAWVCTNQRYPASVAAELEDARNDYLAHRELVTDGPPPPDLIDAARELIEELPTDGSLPGTATLKLKADALRAALTRYDTTARYRNRAVDWEAYLTRCLIALIPGLEAWEADLLLPEQRLGWLFDLGYFARDQESQEAASGDDQRPPELARSSTGDVPVPDLAGSTT